MFGFGGGFNGPGGGSTNSGSAPSGGAGGKAAEKGGRVGGVSSDPRGMDTRGGGSAPSANTSGSRSSDKGGGSMERGRSIDRAGVTGYAGDSKTHEQDIAERHAERQDHVERSLAAGGRMSTNVEGMTAYDESARRARQIGGVIDQTNTALRSNDLMSPFSLESTWDTRYRPNIQTPVASARQYQITPNALAAGGAKPIDSTADVGRYRAVDAFAYGPSTFTDIKNDLAVETANKDAAPGLSAANFASQYLGASAKGGRVTGVAEKGDRVGDSMHGMAAPDPTRFGGALSTEKGDRLGFGAAMGAPTAEIDRAAQARAAERTSMDTYDAAARTREDNAKRADMAQAVRADENTSMGRYSAAAALSEANAQRADAASSIRTAENTSMTGYNKALNNFLGTTVKAEGGVVDPYNTLSGGKKADIENMTIAEAAAYAKNSWKGKTANVLGGPQFKDTTLTSIANDLGISLDTKMTPDVQSQLALGLAQRRANKATVNGVVDIDKFANQLAQEWASFGIPGNKSFYSKNGIDKASVSYAQTRQMAQDMVDTGVVGPNRNLKSMADDRVAAVEFGAPKNVVDHPVTSRFASTGFGGVPGAGRVGTITGVSPEVAYFGDAPTGISDEESAKNVQLQEQRQREAAAAPEDATPKNASIAGGDKPKAAEGDFPDRPRSNFEKFAAAGLDIGAGLIPGVGLGVGLVNGALSLTGNRTIGERLVDAIATGGGKYTPGAPGDPNRPTVVADATTIPQKTIPTVESFADSYLNPPDTTKYPTPYQRYDVNRNTYAGV